MAARGTSGLRGRGRGVPTARQCFSVNATTAIWALFATDVTLGFGEEFPTLFFSAPGCRALQAHTTPAIRLPQGAEPEAALSARGDLRHR